ncbi:3-bisphosphoglycerate-independent phosphoglycerate mutase [Striga asiatica]|uniref:3-bisphosphoglycerate-independent phosphoglycerate mutase n=1 Tax=Striga asiatica TaxID=4170 RepID=A0A5A7QHC4_STRAF|nr:3-bisphosphoglycerate-independent phosphoglycerate mutase [Striga asiatica]
MFCSCEALESVKGKQESVLWDQCGNILYENEYTSVQNICGSVYVDNEMKYENSVDVKNLDEIKENNGTNPKGFDSLFGFTFWLKDAPIESVGGVCHHPDRRKPAVLLAVYSTETKARNGKPANLSRCRAGQNVTGVGMLRLGLIAIVPQNSTKILSVIENGDGFWNEILVEDVEIESVRERPVLRILGHCLLGLLNADEVEDATSMAIHRMYARASNDLVPQAILATRSFTPLLEPKRRHTRSSRRLARWQMRPIRR